ncbi:UdgX family uracil-DNA binding protein [Sphingobium sp. DEHP117]|uniref:UdgX family uracil-DNA binding protein n=1 Tax=Sphingobium sp. DEHP117 TaxID=2993436 RepID=UPI0027D686C5|nr:UdgX family uracil-DNA binding protein [Sphingobium sp. DEHP117]MDQ4421855.1 UdgX family uracil-DNA binding protein [Sphingobium sp. DEHP117]
MTAAREADATVSVQMDAPDDFEAWRAHARALMQARVAPERVMWSEPGETGNLLGLLASAPFPAAADAPPPRASRAFLQQARSVICHRDPERFALLYRVLWRLQRQPRLMEDQADANVRRMAAMAKEVRRDIHKMRAFVRFRLVESEDGASEHYVAWFEPDHNIVRANARFFTDRFAAMRWSILTPELSIHWDGAQLLEGPGASARDAPQGDPLEDLWKRYYASIFNPARLKVKAMLKEMPRRYWKNMPETALIGPLIADARNRELAMIAQGEDSFEMEQPDSLDAVASAVSTCTRCPIGCNGTRAVPGEGPADSAVMLVGEQPGDQEELAGRPFVGPAGQVLDRHLKRAGLERDRLYLANAVKHFKFTPRGPRHIHQTPTAGEIDTCRFWLDAERALVKPRLIVALGASAARGILGRTPSIQRERGRAIALADGSELWITVHPSYLLRVPDAIREQEEAAFARDLAAVAARCASLG